MSGFISVVKALLKCPQKPLKKMYKGDQGTPLEPFEGYRMVRDLVRGRWEETDA